MQKPHPDLFSEYLTFYTNILSFSQIFSLFCKSFHFFTPPNFFLKYYFGDGLRAIHPQATNLFKCSLIPTPYKATTCSPNHFNMINATLSTLRKHSENTQKTLKKHSENTKKTLRKHSENTKKKHSENTQRTLKDHLDYILACLTPK